MRFNIITIFPDIFESYFNTSIIGRARQRQLIQIKVHDLRNFTTNKHRQVDDVPYGGGAGMVLMAEPIIKAVDKIMQAKINQSKKTKVLLFSAKGKQLNQQLAVNWSKLDQIILIAGRYEGVDERVKTALKAEEVSIGPYVLTDGEVPAMAVVSAVTRLLPGVIKEESLNEESFGNWKLETGNAAKREYPQYTRPEVIQFKGKKFRVPRVLLSGHHSEIKKWRREQSKQTKS